MISCFMQGGPSQMDICDPKPQLDEWAGRDFRKDQVRQRRSSEQQSAGQQMEVQETRPMRHGFSDSCRLWRGGDELCLIRSMHTGVNNHGQSIHAMNSGRTKGRPHWVAGSPTASARKTKTCLPTWCCAIQRTFRSKAYSTGHPVFCPAFIKAPSCARATACPQSQSTCRIAGEATGKLLEFLGQLNAATRVPVN